MIYISHLYLSLVMLFPDMNVDNLPCHPARLFLSTGADCSGEDGDQHSVRVQHEGRQVPVQGRDPIGSRVLVPTHLYALGQHARQDWTGTQWQHEDL